MAPGVTAPGHRSTPDPRPASVVHDPRRRRPPRPGAAPSGPRREVRARGGGWRVREAGPAALDPPERAAGGVPRGARDTAAGRAASVMGRDRRRAHPDLRQAVPGGVRRDLAAAARRSVDRPGASRSASHRSAGGGVASPTQSLRDEVDDTQEAANTRRRSPDPAGPVRRAATTAAPLSLTAPDRRPVGGAHKTRHRRPRGATVPRSVVRRAGAQLFACLTRAWLTSVRFERGTRTFCW